MSSRLQDITSYLQRLGYDSAPPPTLDALRELQRRHTAEFPFETLATLLRMPVPIDLASLERKLLHEGRGGYCFELNRMFLALLQQLGYDARGLTARVLMGGPEDALPARTHLLVLVTIDGVRYIADVGFGGMVPTAPLRLDREEAQATPHESYRIEPRNGQYLLRAQVGGEWRAMYLFDLQTQVEIDYEVGNWYVSAHPESPFLGQLFVARTGPGLRKTFNNGSFAVHRLGEDSVRRELPDADSVIELLREEFDIRVPAHPQLHAVLERLLAKSAAA